MGCASSPLYYSVEHGIQVFEQLQAMARETVLLHDMNPFTRGARPRAQTIVGLPTFEITDMTRKHRDLSIYSALFTMDNFLKVIF